MAKVSKRYQEVYEKIDRVRQYPLDKAIQLVKETASANFDETVELHIKLGADPTKGDQTVRGTLVLPHGTGKVPRVAVFAPGEMAQEIREAGADRVGDEDLVKAIEEGWDDFDILVAHPQMMGLIGSRLGPILGPRMPSKKAGNITPNVVQAVEDLKRGRTEYRMDRGGVIHLPVGKVSFDDEQLRENIVTVIETIQAARPSTVTGRFMLSATLSATMGAGIKLDLPSLIG